MLIMRQHQQLFAITACLCSFVVVFVSAVPLPANNQELDVLQIPLSDGKELDVLTLSAKDQEQIIAERNKRTIGLLRELFPDITKQIDDIVNRIIGQVIRVAGPSLLPALLGNNNRPTTESSDFDADFEDDDDSSSNNINSKDVDSVFSKTDANTLGAGGSADDASRVNIALPTFSPDSGEATQTTTTTEPPKKVSFSQVGAEKATTDIPTSTTTAAATKAMKNFTTRSGTTIKAPMSPQSTTKIATTTITTITSRPTTSTTTPASPPTIPQSITTTITVSAPITTTTTTTMSTPVATTVPIPITSTTNPSSTIPTTTIDAILVIPRNKGQSRSGINRNNNNDPTTQQPATIENETKNSFIPIQNTSTDLPTNPSPIPDILSTTTNTLTRTTETQTLPTPSLPATYIGTFDSGLAEQQLQKPSTRSLTQKELEQQKQKQNQNSQSNSLPFAVDVDRTQLVALVDNINRLLNSPNLFTVNRNNTNTTQFTTTTTNEIATTKPSKATPSTRLTTANITKLLPNGATDTQIDLSAINKQLEETIRVARQVKEAEANAQAAAQQQQSGSAVPAQIPIPSKTDANAPIQLSFSNEATPLSTAPDNSKPVNNDLRSTDSKSPAIDELTLDSNEDTADLDDRNKRFLSFGGAGVAGGSGGNAGGNAAASGGSGNFLFDIIRLFSGSVQTQTGDEAANSANSVSADGDAGGDSDANRAADGFTEGIPGPVTRLVVLANRGLANLIQDLILRVAATSEKFVNFKAKLITALI